MHFIDKLRKFYQDNCIDFADYGINKMFEEIIDDAEFVFEERLEEIRQKVREENPYLQSEFL